MSPLSFKRHRFPPDVIRHAVWLYFRFTMPRGVSWVGGRLRVFPAPVAVLFVWLTQGAPISNEVRACYTARYDWIQRKVSVQSRGLE